MFYTLSEHSIKMYLRWHDMTWWAALPHEVSAYIYIYWFGLCNVGLKYLHYGCKLPTFIDVWRL